MATHAKRYKLMPIPPVDQHTRFFEAGKITIGVEYRLLNNDIVNAHMDAGNERIEINGELNDRGVSIHVYGEGEGGQRTEHLRFDCFEEDPHYHYVDWRGANNDIVQIDTVADGDSLAWALDRIRTRLPQMLERAGADQAAKAVDSAALEAVLPRVSEAAYRARYQHDDEVTLKAALG